MLNLKSKPAILKYHRWFNRQMSILEKKNKGAIKSILKQQYKDAADYVSHGLGIQSINESINYYEKDLIKAYTQLYQSTIKVFHEEALKQLKSSRLKIELKTTEEQYWYNINKWVKDKTAKKVVRVQQTTKNNIKRIIEKGLDEGQANKEIAKEITGLAEITTMFRAERIVRTEVHAAAVNAINENMIDTGMAMTKRWSAAQDERTREDHSIADETYAENPIPLDESFFVGNELLEFPGDPDGSAGNVINCRCVVLYETQTEGE